MFSVFKISVFVPLACLTWSCKKDHLFFYKKGKASSQLNCYTLFLQATNTFTSNTRLKLVKNHAKAKQHPEDEFLLFENYSSSMLSSKTYMRYSKKLQKSICFNYMINYDENQVRIKNGSHTYNIELGQDMDTNILDIKCTSVWWWLLCAISNT